MGGPLPDRRRCSLESLDVSIVIFSELVVLGHSVVGQNGSRRPRKKQIGQYWSSRWTVNRCLDGWGVIGDGFDERRFVSSGESL